VNDLVGPRAPAGREHPRVGASLELSQETQTSRDSINDMKTISVGVSEVDYEAFREAARRTDRSIAQLIREAMTRYRETELEPRRPLRSVPVLSGHRSAGRLPSRSDLYDEIFDSRAGEASGVSQAGAVAERDAEDS